MGGRGGGRKRARDLLQARGRSSWGHPIAALLVLAPATASAHAYLTSPEPRTTTSVSPGPCGDGPTTGARTVFDAGQTIVVQWDAEISHYGTYRLRFSPGDDAGFEDGELLVVDDDPDVAVYEESITLPQCSCTDCTLQLWQAPGSGEGGYYSCADIELRALGSDVSPCPMAAVEEPDGGTSGDDTTGGGEPEPDPSTGDSPEPEPDPDPTADPDDGAVDPTFGGEGESSGDATSGDGDPGGGDQGDAGGCSLGGRTSASALAMFGVLAGVGRRRSRTRG